jgi:hypothetical protein
MTALDQLLGLVPLAGKKAPATREANAALHPPTVPATVKTGTLKHKDAGLPGDPSLPPRVVAVLGPGATFDGLAGVLLPVYEKAGALTPPLKRDELAKGLLVYNQAFLTADRGEHHKVGLCLPLPIEIDTGTGAWTVDAKQIRDAARPASFKSAWTSRLTRPPDVLSVPEPAQTEGEAQALLTAGTAATRAAGLWQRLARNPSEVLLTLFATLRRIVDTGGAGGPGQALTLALAIIGNAAPHQAALLAATRAGNGVLRRFELALKAAPPAGTDPAKVAAAKELIDKALREGPVGARKLVAHREVPATVDLLAARGGSAAPTAGARADPGGGLHVLVHGRDVAVGRSEGVRAGGKTTTGPALAGRLLLDPFLVDDAKGLNPAKDPDTNGRLVLLALDGLGPGGSRFDAVAARDATKLLTIGLRNWAATDPAGIGAVLFEFKAQAPDEFDLYFALHGLDVDRDPADATRFRLRKIGPDGTSTVMNAAALQAFLGGTVDAKGNVTFGAEWAARFRLPALVSRRYRRAQVLVATRQMTFKALDLAVAGINPFPDRFKLEFDSARSTALKARLDAELTPFLAAKDAAGVKSAKTLGGAVIDLTGGLGVTPAYAGASDTDTFYVGSMNKVAAMYAAFELRTRLRLAFARAKPHLPTAAAGWHVTFLQAVKRIWRGRITAGFPGFATTDRLPKFTDMFAFPSGAGAGINFQKGTATIAEIALLDVGHPLPTMKFSEMITSMILMSNPFAAGIVITSVDYPYVNGLLREAGFYDPGTKTGIWVSASYDSRDWKPGVDPHTLSARGTLHYKAKTNLVGNAREFARLLALADRKVLFEGNGPVCDEMVKVMTKFGIPHSDTSFNRDAIDATPDGFGGRKPAPKPAVTVDKVFSKIGIGDAAPGKVIRGIHDCAIIERKRGGTTLRYVVVGVGGYDRGADVPAYDGTIQILDGAVAEGHP